VFRKFNILKFKNSYSQNCTIAYRGYHGNYTYNPSNCFSLGHGSDFGRWSASLVGSTSQISSYAILLLATLGYSAVPFGDSQTWHITQYPKNTTSKFHSNLSTSSLVETCGQTDGLT
jgi:hypothetical protein